MQLHAHVFGIATRRALSGKDRVRRFFRTGYQAKSWSLERRVVARVEATSRGADIRFLVSNLPGRAKVLYDKVYCARGRMENMIKDHKLYTLSDRTSCHRWEANRLCNLTSGNSFGVCALSPTEGHAPRWGDPFSWYSMKKTNPTWSTKYAERAGYGD